MLIPYRASCCSSSFRPDARSWVSARTTQHKDIHTQMERYRTKVTGGTVTVTPSARAVHTHNTHTSTMAHDIGAYCAVRLLSTPTAFEKLNV